jgi:hypothetical protein
MIETNRKTVTKHKFVHFEDFFQSDVEQTAVYIQKLWEEGWTEIEYDESEVTLTQRRLETVKEYEERIKMEEDFEKRRISDIDHQRKHRYQQYLKLKEEFGEFREHWQEAK